MIQPEVVIERVEVEFCRIYPCVSITDRVSWSSLTVQRSAYPS